MYETGKLNRIKDSDELLRSLFVSFLRQAGAAMGGFFASCASFDGLAPFGVALSAAIGCENIPACVLGCTAGYFYIYGITALTLRYIAAAAVAGIFAYLLKRSFKPKFHRYFSAAAGFFSVFATGLILSLSVTVSAEEFILYGAEGAAAGAGAWMFDRFVNIGSGKKRASMLCGSEVAAVLTVFGVLLLALNSFPVYIFSLGVIFGAYAVLVSATYGGDKFGSLSGICAGVVLGFSQSTAFVTGGMALGGLLAGIFSRKNRFISSVVFILSVAITAFAAEDSRSASYIIYDVGIAALLFILTPGKLKSMYLDVFAFSDGGTFLSGQRNAVKMRLKTASDGMNEVASAVRAVGGIYRRRTVPKKENICENVCSKVCSKCEKYSVCWNENYGKTLNCFENICKAFRQDGTTENPDEFLSFCLTPEKAVSALSAETERYRNAMREAAKTGETVNIVSDQFSSVSDILGELSYSMDCEDEYLPDLSELVKKYVDRELRYETLSCAVFRSAGAFIYCEISFAPQVRIDAQIIAESISELLDIRLEKPVVMRLGDGTTNFCVCQRTKYRVESGARQISSDGGKWCGDTYDSFYDGKGRFYMVLSDGMGTGKKAAADSVMCCSLCTSLLRAGFSADSILKVINSAMLVRSGEESIATLDIAVLDLYDGSVCFYKAGASFSVAMKHLKMLRIEKPSLPVGILREIAFEKIELNLRDGDAFVLMSDGVPGEAVSVWREILRDAAEYDGDELADKLTKTAYMNCRNDTPDDITVMTAAVTVNEL